MNTLIKHRYFFVICMFLLSAITFAIAKLGIDLKPDPGIFVPKFWFRLVVFSIGIAFFVWIGISKLRSPSKF